MKLSPEEWRKKEIKEMSGFVKFLYFIWIIRFRVHDRNFWNNNNDFYLEEQIFNPYNPLTYLFIVILFPISIIFQGIKKTLIEFKKGFKFE